MCGVGEHRLLHSLIKHMVAEQPGSSMPKNTKGMKFNPNRDAHSSLSEVNLSIQTNKQSIEILCAST